MASERTAAAIEHDLRIRALSGATLSDLLSHVDEQDRRAGTGLSPEQWEELRLYCWALHKRGSLALREERARIWSGLEYDQIDG